MRPNALLTCRFVVFWIVNQKYQKGYQLWATSSYFPWPNGQRQAKVSMLLSLVRGESK
jgi:hypothetical protein